MKQNDTHINKYITAIKIHIVTLVNCVTMEQCWTILKFYISIIVDSIVTIYCYIGFPEYGDMTLPRRQAAFFLQFWVEVEHYSIAYFDRITMFKALQRKISVKGSCCAMSPALNRSFSLQHFEHAVNTNQFAQWNNVRFLPNQRNAYASLNNRNVTIYQYASKPYRYRY